MVYLNIYFNFMKRKSDSFEYLFNYNGDHVATFAHGQLYSLDGNNIGHYIESINAFVDLEGFYLGEVPFLNRLLFGEYNTTVGIGYGNREAYCNIGQVRNLVNGGPIEKIEGYRDINPKLLR